MGWFYSITLPISNHLGLCHSNTGVPFLALRRALCLPPPGTDNTPSSTPPHQTGLTAFSIGIPPIFAGVHISLASWVELALTLSLSSCHIPLTSCLFLRSPDISSPLTL